MSSKPAIILVMIAIVLAGCSALPIGIGATSTPPPTYTPLPTYTALPTYTPPPSPTATFPPTATVPSLETPTGQPGASAASPTAPASGGVLATVTFSSVLREGPGTNYDGISEVPAGTVVTILGRNDIGNWVFVRTPAGREGWIRVTQFEGGVDTSLLPVVTDYPTPSITNTPRPGTGTPVPSGTQPLPTPGGANYSFNLTRGGSQQCITFSWYLSSPVPSVPPNETIPPFDPTTALSTATPAYSLDRSQVPSSITVAALGDLRGQQCHPTQGTCQFVVITLCATASASAPTGANSNPVVLIIGNQIGTRLDELLRMGIPTVFNVSP